MTRSAVFLRQVETFLKHSEMAPSAFGKIVAGDPNFVFDLQKGRRPNVDLVDHAQRFMSRHERAKTRALKNRIVAARP